MNLKKNNEPPRWALAFFHWFCHPQFREEIEGDLKERFQRRTGQCSAIRNKFLFTKEIITLFRPSLIGGFHQLTFNRFSCLKRMARRLPEYYLMLLVLLTGYTPPFSVSSVALWIVVVLVLLVIFRNNVIWTLVASLFLIINFYMILALISEFSEFPAFVTGARNLIFGGSVILILNIAMCGALLIRHAEKSKKAVFKALSLMTSGWYALAFTMWSNRLPGTETSHFLFYAGTILLIFTLIAGTIVVYRFYKKDTAMLGEAIN